MPMNVRVPVPVRETQAAEGLPRRGFTVAEVERMVEVGILDEDERVELVGGELVPMSPKGNFHEVLKRALTQRWARLEGVHVLVETTLRLCDDTFVEPDLVLIPATQPTFELKASDCLLIVELADSSLSYDLNRKPVLYAAASLPELWVVNARHLTATVLLSPAEGAYTSVHSYGPDDTLRPTLVSAAAVVLGALDLR